VVEPSEEEMDEERRLWENVWEELIVAVGLEEAAKEPLRDMMVGGQAVDGDRYGDDDGSRQRERGVSGQLRVKNTMRGYRNEEGQGGRGARVCHR